MKQNQCPYNLLSTDVAQSVYLYQCTATNRMDSICVRSTNDELYTTNKQSQTDGPFSHSWSHNVTSSLLCPSLEGELQENAMPWPFARKNSFCFWLLTNFIKMPCIAVMGMVTVLHTVKFLL